MLFWNSLQQSDARTTIAACSGADCVESGWRQKVQRREQSCRDELNPQGTVLVTGGAGYIGSLLVLRLLERGYRVRVVDRLLYGGAALRDTLSHPNFELIVADFRNFDVVMHATESVDAVIHLGAIVGDSACDLDEELTRTTNVDATGIIADACRARDIARLVFVSTCSVYGASDEALDETSALNPVSLYARSKIAAEQLLLAHANFAFRPIILRLGTAYGFSPRPRFDLVVNWLTAQALAEGRIAIHGGAQWRPFVHLEDINQALMLSLEAPLESLGGEIFNVGANEHNHQLSELGSLIGEAVPTTEVATLDHVVDRRNYYVDFAKARHVLGFLPTRGLRDGVREIKAAIESGLVSQFRDSRYHNHLHLRDLPSESWLTRSRANASDTNFGELIAH
jgi:nucleoside-diphosphate-sugar epimerase